MEGPWEQFVSALDSEEGPWTDYAPEKAPAVRSVGKSIADTVGTVAGVVESIPAGIIGPVSYGAKMVADEAKMAITGERPLRKERAVEAQKFANEMVDKVAKVTEGSPLDHPFTRIMKYFGHTGDFSGSDVHKVLTKVSAWAEKGAGYIEEKTKGSITSEDTLNTLNLAMSVSGAKGIVGVSKAAGSLTKKLGQTKPAEAAKVEPVWEDPLAKQAEVVEPTPEVSGDPLRQVDPIGQKVQKYQEKELNKPINAPIVSSSQNALFDVMDSMADRIKNPLPGKFNYTPSMGKSFKTAQGGSVSKDLLTYLGPTVAGAMLDQEDPLSGALFGMAAGALISKVGSLAKNVSVVTGKLGDAYYKPDLSKIVAPDDLYRGYLWTRSSAQADTTVLRQRAEAAVKMGVTPAMDRMFRDFTEKSITAMPPKETVLYTRVMQPLLKDMEEGLAEIKDPAARQLLWEEISTRMARNHNSWIDALGSVAMQAGGGVGYGKVPSALKSRTVMALDDGTIITTKQISSGKYEVTGWKDGQATALGASADPMVPGTIFKGAKVVQAKQADIEANTPIRYVESDIATVSAKVAEIRKYIREKNLTEELLASPTAAAFFHKEGAGPTPAGWVIPKGAERIPGLRGVSMEPRYAEVFEDFTASHGGLGVQMEFAKNFMIRAMMLNPAPHIKNELVHWYDARGISGLITPTGIPGGASKGLYGMATTLPKSIRSVLLQDELQVELAKSGGMLMYMSTKNQLAWTDMLNLGLKDAVKTKNFKEMAKSLALAPGELASKVSNASSKIMWSLRDMMYTQLVLEQKSLHPGMSTNEAVLEVGRHMPEYYIPTRAFGSRTLTQTAKSPLLVFSPYHYGMTRAVVEMGKDITSGKLGATVKGMDQIAAMLVGYSIMFPIMDAVVQGAMSNENLEVRRGGPYHLMNAMGKVMDGEKAYPAVATSLLTPNPAIMTAAELLHNRYIFSGQEIIQSETDAATKAVDLARYLGSRFSPAQTAQLLLEGKATTSEQMYKQFDIIESIPEKAARQKAMRERMGKAGKRHEKKMKDLYGYGDEE